MNLDHFQALLHALADRTRPIDPLVHQLLQDSAYDLYARRPGPALLDNGVLRPTDLDLACFLSALADRGAVINLPTYERRRAKTTREGEHVVSAANRHGKILSLSANKEALSFSVKIEDANVITSESVGAPRNFMVVDVEGGWYDGWKTIEFMPSRKENAFLTDNALWTGRRVVFENFVHPNRWAAIFGRPYLALKLALARLEAEAQHLFAEQKRLVGMGVRRDRVPLEDDADAESRPKSETGSSKPIQVQAFETEVDGPAPSAAFPALEPTWEALAGAYQRRKFLVYTLCPKIRFTTRATELAFVKNGGPERHPPAWSPANAVGWKRGVVFPGKRTAWTQAYVGTGLALRTRLYMKTERVAS